MMTLLSTDHQNLSEENEIEAEHPATLHKNRVQASHSTKKFQTIRRKRLTRDISTMT